MTTELKRKGEELESVLYTAQMCLGIRFKYSLFIQVGKKNSALVPRVLVNKGRTFKYPQNNILLHFSWANQLLGNQRAT